ncbi:hypothetical protein DM01DRAFT_1096078 [Hesseltinella vesiculosa]|uniref:Uncharacterized protein n=1 Tax=Hesseltinella vesiculosa TaxID=101127 RepID=A0A1X2GDJ0_9FUNG|nr:hypothetical protein DM01DRAFT_1096078 [Hesseltinella vesiculosa]
MKAVRFHPILETVAFTYSATDYDRSYLPIPASPCSNSYATSVFLKPHESFPEPSSLQVSSTPLSRPAILPLDFSNINVSSKPKKLSINTSITRPPLYFTSLSTQYKDAIYDDDDDDNDSLPSTSSM